MSSQIILEVADFHDVSGTQLREFLLSDQFIVTKYHAKNTSLGCTLKEINRKIIDRTIENDLQQSELFYNLAESIITDQRFVFDHMLKMDFKKVITNEEVFRAVLAAKSFIDGHMLENISLEKICMEVGISKYHFIRLFKNTFSISPYQYLKKKRLTYSKMELSTGKPIAEVAGLFGFADVQSFNKAFKKGIWISSKQKPRNSNFGQLSPASARSLCRNECDASNLHTSVLFFSSCSCRKRPIAT